MNKKLVVLLLAISLVFLTIPSHQLTAGFTFRQQPYTLLPLLPLTVLLILALVLPETKRVSEYRQKSAEFLSKLFDEDPDKIIKAEVYHISEMPKYEQVKEFYKSPAQIRSYYHLDEDRIYYNPRRGYGEWVHEITHAIRFRKGFATSAGPNLPQADDIVARLVEDIVSDYSYKSFNKKMEREIEPYKILDQDLKPIYKARLTYHLIGHTLASLYRRGKISFEDVKRLCSMQTEKLVEESVRILEENERYIQPSIRKLVEAL